MADDSFAVVNTQQKGVSKGQLKLIMKGTRENWPSGGKAIVLLNKDDKIMEDFCKSFMGMSYKEFQGLQVQNNIRSGKAYPRKVSTRVILALVSKSKNFIGVVPSELAKGDNIIGVK